MKSQQPLTAEERALAEQLARLGPHDEPSPALDARILAAARAEISRPSAQPKPRWPVAFGLAASALLAVGVAWQLRPVDEAPRIVQAPAIAEMPAEQPAASQAVESSRLMEQQQADAAAEPSPPPPAHALATPPAEPFPAAPKLEPKPQSRSAARPASPSPARKPAPAPEAAPRQLASPPAPPTTSSAKAETIPLPLPPPAPASTSQARAAFASDPPASEREASDAIRSESDNYRSRSAAADAATQRARRQEQRALAEEGPTLDRVVTTGSRLQRTDLQVPVHDDARLAPDEWLERIRLRRDLGDGASAAASLRLYVQEHPFRKVPEDLRPLLAE